MKSLDLKILNLKLSLFGYQDLELNKTRLELIIKKLLEKEKQSLNKNNFSYLLIIFLKKYYVCECDDFDYLDDSFSCLFVEIVYK